MPRPRWDDDFDDEDAPRQIARGKRTHPPRNEFDQAFKCGHCRQFIGAPVAGGRQRNHCPNCLYSKHVDDTMPGDRKSDCGSLMAPVGLMTRRNGEMVLIHECRGCGKQAPNRIAADDNPVVLETIPVVAGIGIEEPVEDDLWSLVPEEFR